jgi:uncharacterized lipoprotein YmbA
VSLVVAGCASTPPARHYTLSAEANDSHRLATSQRKIEIVSVRIPEVWDRPQIVVTKSSSEVSLNEYHRWAAPLRTEVPRVVTRNLARILDTQTVWLRRDFVGAQPDLRVQVSIEHIDAVPGEALQLQAAWLIRAETGASNRSGRTAIVEPLTDSSYDAVVAATGRALLAMSIALAKDIQAMPM